MSQRGTKQNQPDPTMNDIKDDYEIPKLPGIKLTSVAYVNGTVEFIGLAATESISADNMIYVEDNC